MQCMELKLGTHVYLSVSMTTIDKKLPQALFSVPTSLLLKLANHGMHGNETWYTCVFQRFRDNHEQKMALGTFSYNYFFTSQLANHAIHGSETCYAYVFQCFHDKHEQKMASGTFSHNYFFTSQTCKPCNAWK